MFNKADLTRLLFFLYLAGVELDESLLPKMALYCGGPPGGAANKHFHRHHNTTKHNVRPNMSPGLRA